MDFDVLIRIRCLLGNIVIVYRFRRLGMWLRKYLGSRMVRPRLIKSASKFFLIRSSSIWHWLVIWIFFVFHLGIVYGVSIGWWSDWSGIWIFFVMHPRIVRIHCSFVGCAATSSAEWIFEVSRVAPSATSRVNSSSHSAIRRSLETLVWIQGVLIFFFHIKEIKFINYRLIQKIHN